MSLFFKNCFNILPILLFTMLFTYCRPDDKPLTPEYKKPYELSNDVAVEWNKFYLSAERFTPGYNNPCISGRTQAYINLAAYESIVLGMPDKYNSIASSNYGLIMPTIKSTDTYAWAIVMNNAFKYGFKNFFPNAPSAQQLGIERTFDNIMDKYEQDFDAATIERSLTLGREVAEIIYTWSRTDKPGDAAYNKVKDPSYVPPVGPDKWQPTNPDYQAAVLSYWGDVRPFAATEADLSIYPPVEFSTDPNSEFYKQAKETRDLCNAARSNAETSEDFWIAQFWSDDCPTLTFSPAGRWIAICNEILTAEKMNLAESAVVYTKVAMSQCDAGIGSWKNKYIYNLLRPVDYIQKYMGDTEWKTVMCPDGTGKYFTPPFPTYPSGHGTFGSAAAKVLASIFGDNYQLTDRCHEGRTEFKGTPRTFQSFTQMAEENAYSRLPLGVHFRMDAIAALDLGGKIGTRVAQMKFKK